MVFLTFLILNLSTLFLAGEAYDIPVKYFVSCGSAETVTDSNRSFSGDEKPAKFSVANHKASAAVTAANSANASTIYSTARIFHGNSSYAFPTETPDAEAIYLVRLHFFAFASPSANLSAAVFDVAVVDSGLLLLRNFTGKLAVEAPVVKEFQVTAKTSKFRVHFLPRGSSFAFVNAIEVFPAPPTSFDVGDATKVGEKAPVKSPVLETVYRINVGGGVIEPGQEGKVWRRWEADDEFLKTKGNAINATFSSKPPSEYLQEDGEFAAPANVYQTAKKMNTVVNGSDDFNITWGFQVNESATHIVRAHFCNIISESANVLVFKLYINGGFSEVINIEVTHVANYYDFAVGSLGSSGLNISIGPSNDSYQKDAYLSGLEILEVKVGSVSVPAVEDEPAGKPNLAVVIGSAAGGSVMVLCALVAGFIVVRRRQRQKAKATELSSWGHVGGHGGGSSPSRVTEATTNGSRSPFMYLGLKLSLSEIRSATKNFSPKLVIGRGGFGVVYKGTFANGTVVAVKRSKPGMDQGPNEFETEITILSKIRHRHLVSLIGYCDEQGEMILVYEFMEKGTLRDHLYGSRLGPSGRLTWKQRLEICIDSAKGLEYLHKGSAGGVIHRDVKTTNILLDENFVAKVADFGLSKSTPPEDTHISTAVKGTLGYLDPEYFLLRHLTDKSDVYSFGVVLFEVLCARAPIEPTLPRERVNLAHWAVKCLEKGAIEEIVDPAMPGRIDPNSLRKFAETAAKCLLEDGADRPTMGDVKWDLEYALQLQQMPATREPHDDSTATGSSFFATGDMILPGAQLLPTLDTLHDDEDETCVGGERDFSDATGGTGVFSQLATDGAR